MTAADFKAKLDRKPLSLDEWLAWKADEDPDLHAAILEALEDPAVTVVSLTRALNEEGYEGTANPVYKWRQQQKT